MQVVALSLRLRSVVKRALGYSFVRFLVVGGSSYLLVTSLTITMHEFFGFSERISAACGLFTAFCVNFLSLRFFVFSSTSPPVTQIGKFATASLSFRLLEFTGFSIFFGLGLHYILALTITMVMGTFLKYFFYRKFVFN